MPTALDKNIGSHAKHLILGFGALVVVATGLTLALTGSTSTNTVQIKHENIVDDLDGEPQDWSEDQLREWLRKV
jgi:hypothetical protein